MPVTVFLQAGMKRVDRECPSATSCLSDEKSASPDGVPENERRIIGSGKLLFISLE